MNSHSFAKYLYYDRLYVIIVILLLIFSNNVPLKWSRVKKKAPSAIQPTGVEDNEIPCYVSLLLISAVLECQEVFLFVSYIYIYL